MSRHEKLRASGRVAFGAALALPLVAALAVTPAFAQGKAPTGPIEITVGAGAGGSPDVIMRTIAKIMNEEKIVENPIVVQNRTGGAHSNAYNHVLGRKGDENTLLTLASAVFTTPIVQGTPSAIDQTVPIAGFIQSDLVLLVPMDSPHKTMKDFAEAAKAAPGRTRIAGGASGGTDHLATALVEKAVGTKLTYVPHESGSAAQASFLGGNVEGHFATLEEGLALIEGKRARGIAVLTEARRTEDQLKDLPTAKEQGYDIVFGQFWGVSGPPGLDPQVAIWWEDKFRKATETAAWKDSLKKKFQRGDFYGLEKAGAYFKKEQETFRSLLTELGLAKK